MTGLACHFAKSRLRAKQRSKPVMDVISVKSCLEFSAENGRRDGEICSVGVASLLDVFA